MVEIGIGLKGLSAEFLGEKTMMYKADGHFKRYKEYDYSRGAVVFVTISVLKRQPVFGRVSDSGMLEPSPLGLAAGETLVREAARQSGIERIKSVIMPNHVHLRLWIRPGLDAPLAKLAAFIRNFKRWTKWRGRQLGVDFDWKHGYHDCLCLSEEMIVLVDKYIENNPLKWSLMHGNPPPLKVVEPFDSPLLPRGEWWSAVGAVNLFTEHHRFCAIQLSRKISPCEFAMVVDRVMAIARGGFVLMGTFSSPCECALAKALQLSGAPMICAVPDSLASVYRPKGDEPGQFASGRLCLLSRVSAPNASCGASWHEINEVLGKIAVRSGGLALCVAPGPNGSLVWKQF